MSSEPRSLATDLLRSLHDAHATPYAPAAAAAAATLSSSEAKLSAQTRVIVHIEFDDPDAPASTMATSTSAGLDYESMQVDIGRAVAGGEHSDHNCEDEHEHEHEDEDEDPESEQEEEKEQDEENEDEEHGTEVLEMLTKEATQEDISRVGTALQLLETVNFCFARFLYHLLGHENVVKFNIGALGNDVLVYWHLRLLFEQEPESRKLIAAKTDAKYSETLLYTLLRLGLVKSVIYVLTECSMNAYHLNVYNRTFFEDFCVFHELERNHLPPVLVPPYVSAKMLRVTATFLPSLSAAVHLLTSKKVLTKEGAVPTSSADIRKVALVGDEADLFMTAPSLAPEVYEIYVSAIFDDPAVSKRGIVWLPADLQLSAIHARRLEVRRVSVSSSASIKCQLAYAESKSATDAKTNSVYVAALSPFCLPTSPKKLCIWTSNERVRDGTSWADLELCAVDIGAIAMQLLFSRNPENLNQQEIYYQLLQTCLTYVDRVPQADFSFHCVPVKEFKLRLPFPGRAVPEQSDPGHGVSVPVSYAVAPSPSVSSDEVRRSLGYHRLLRVFQLATFVYAFLSRLPPGYEAMWTSAVQRLNLSIAEDAKLLCQDTMILDSLVPIIWTFKHHEEPFPVNNQEMRRHVMDFLMRFDVHGTLLKFSLQMKPPNSLCLSAAAGAESCAAASPVGSLQGRVMKHIADASRLAASEVSSRGRALNFEDREVENLFPLLWTPCADRLEFGDQVVRFFGTGIRYSFSWVPIVFVPHLAQLIASETRLPVLAALTRFVQSCACIQARLCDIPQRCETINQRFNKKFDGVSIPDPHPKKHYMLPLLALAHDRMSALGASITTTAFREIICEDRDHDMLMTDMNYRGATAWLWVTYPSNQFWTTHTSIIQDVEAIAYWRVVATLAVAVKPLNATCKQALDRLLRFPLCDGPRSCFRAWRECFRGRTARPYAKEAQHAFAYIDSLASSIHSPSDDIAAALSPFEIKSRAVPYVYRIQHEDFRCMTEWAFLDVPELVQRVTVFTDWLEKVATMESKMYHFFSQEMAREKLLLCIPVADTEAKHLTRFSAVAARLNIAITYKIRLPSTHSVKVSSHDTDDAGKRDDSGPMVD